MSKSRLTAVAFGNVGTDVVHHSLVAVHDEEGTVEDVPRRVADAQDGRDPALARQRRQM